MLLETACGNSPTRDSNPNEEVKKPSLENMVLIPAGIFLMGRPEGEGAFDEHPQHEVYLDAFYIDKYEVTNAQFQDFVQATGYVTDAEQKGAWAWVWNPLESSNKVPYLKYAHWGGLSWRNPNAWGEDRPYPQSWEDGIQRDYPVVQVSWNDAQVYAKWAGKRLPTEAEWEKAAKGVNGFKWAWGNEFQIDINGVTTHANINSREGTMPVGSFSTGVSPYGVYDMIGNVEEWVADIYAPDYYAQSPRRNPQGPSDGNFHVLRGCSWRDVKPDRVTAMSRAYNIRKYTSNFVGFRCAWNP